MDHIQTNGWHVYIYKQDFAQQYDKCGARSGSPQLFLNEYVEGYETHYMTTYKQYTHTDIYKHVHTYTILYTHTKYAHTYTNAYTYIETYTHINKLIHTYIHAHIPAYIHVHTYTLTTIISKHKQILDKGILIFLFILNINYNM